MGILIQEEGRVLDYVQEVGELGAERGTIQLWKICIQRSFEQSLKVHIPLIEIFYPQLKNYVKAYDLNLVEILINGIEIT